MCNCHECNTTEAESDALSGLAEDRELNLKMAEVCGMGAQVGLFDWHDPTPPPPCIADYHDHWELVADGAPQVIWNPVDNWQQVFDYVLPALEEVGLEWVLVGGATEYSAAEVWWHDYHIDVRCLSDVDKPLCRCICEAALEAWQQLEKTDG